MNRKLPEKAVRNLWLTAALAPVTMLMSACGGGGGGPASAPPPPTSFSYPSTYYSYTAGPAVGDVTYHYISSSILSNIGGGSWSVSPALPPGLVLNPGNGTIDGQPTSSSPPTAYTVTNVSGTKTSIATLTIAVAAAPLLNLGLINQPTSMRFVNSRILTAEGSQASPVGGWLLQDFASGAILAQGNGVGAPINNNLNWFTDLEGSVMVDLTYAGLEVRSATDGSVISKIPEQPTVCWYLLATDGSYIAAGSPTALMTWSTTGQLQITRAGNYCIVNAFAAPGQIMIANGPAGADVIESDSITTGATSVSASFKGTFNNWFLDGQRFFTNLGNTVWVYSSSAVQQDFTTLSTVNGLNGVGSWFWTGNLDIYQVGASASPVFTASGYLLFSSGNTIGVLSVTGSQDQVTVIDLSGALPTSATYTVPSESYYGPVIYAAESAAEWVVGYSNGVIIDDTTGQPRTLTLGAVTGIAGGTSYFSVATDMGTIYNYRASDDSLIGTISYPSATLWASGDGTVLVALGSGPSPSANVYSLPSGTLINSIAFDQGFTAIAESGSVIAEGLGSSSTSSCDTQIVPAAGGAALYCILIAGPDTNSANDFALSPDGTLAAISHISLGGVYATNIYKNGTLVSAAPGGAVTWLDNDRLLLDESPPPFNFPIPPSSYKIYDSLGNFVSNAANTTNYLCGNPCQIVAPDLIFQGSQIVNYLTGAFMWESGDYRQTGKATATGTQIILAAGDYVLAEPYSTN